MSFSDAEVQAAAAAMVAAGGASYERLAAVALEAAAAVREQAAAKLAEETGTVVSLIYRGLDDAVAPEQVPMVPLSVVAEVREGLAQVAAFGKPKYRHGIRRALDALEVAFPQLKEQSA